MSEPNKPNETELTTFPRDGLGRFQKGGPPGPGRQGLPPEVKAILEAAEPKAAQRLVEALDAHTGKDAKGDDIPDHEMRTRAANALFDRLRGRPAQAITDAAGQSLTVLSVIVLPSEREEP